MSAKEKTEVKKYRKLSRFFWWVLIIGLAVALVFGVYSILSACNLIKAYQALIPNNKYAVAFTFVAVFVIAVSYGGLSLYNLLSHRAVEDSRMHCLPIILSPIFLIFENGFLHLFDTPDGRFYEMTMGIFTTAALGVCTFASLKFSFEISSKRKRFIETSSFKPDIEIEKNIVGNYIAHVSRHDCYLCGLYMGEIEKIEFFDIKRTGNIFKMNGFYFPNRKIHFDIGRNTIDFIKMGDTAAPDVVETVGNNKHDTFCIFRDVENYYYFVKIPKTDKDYMSVGVNEYAMTRLMFEYNKQMNKIVKMRNKQKRVEEKAASVSGGDEKRFIDAKAKLAEKVSEEENKQIRYKTMDWFRIPYNFYSNIK